MPFAIKINGNLWMSFVDGDYRDYKKKGLMHDRFANETECPKCEELPCKCDEERDREKEEKLRDIRGGQ